MKNKLRFSAAALAMLAILCTGCGKQNPTAKVIDFPGNNLVTIQIVYNGNQYSGFVPVEYLNGPINYGTQLNIRAEYKNGSLVFIGDNNTADTWDDFIIEI